jgi:hypothetical protein
MNDIPSTPSVETIQQFEGRFQSYRKVEQLLSEKSPIQAATLAKVDKLRATVVQQQGTSLIAANIVRVEPHGLEVILAMLARFGLREWYPDVLGHTPDSLYNSAHRSIAIQTFKQCLVNFSYLFLAPNTAYAQDHAFLEKLYNHFVFVYMADLVRKEAKVPGSVEVLHDKNSVYNRRSMVSPRNQLY